MSTDVFAAVMTGKGVGAIATIQVFGKKAQAIIEKIFKPSKNKNFSLNPGKIMFGDIKNGKQIIDQVTIGCEGNESFAINCHGNPLIVSDIMQLLSKNKVKPVTTEQIRCKILFGQDNLKTIAIEAKLALPKAKTLAASKLLTKQIESGLNQKASEWLNETYSLKKIKSDAKKILEASKAARPIISGFKAVLAGPANSGKSTLFNLFTGKQKSIVTNIKGTTRDWVTSYLIMEPLFLELIDTAGLNKKLETISNIGKESQQRSVEILESADLVLLVLDGNQPIYKPGKKLLEKITQKKVLTVLNKSDLPLRLNTSKLPEKLSNSVKISAKNGVGIEKLKKKIFELYIVGRIDYRSAICFTKRQEKLLAKVINSKSKQSALVLIEELLNGRLCV